MNFRKAVLLIPVILQWLLVPAQEYYQHISIKKDSVYEGSIRLLGRLQQSGTAPSDEAARNYRDSLMYVLVKSDSSFRSPETLNSAHLPHPAFRIISDLAWNDFKLSANKTPALQQLQRLASAYPDEKNIHGNLALAYELSGRTDSAMAVIDRFLTAHPAGFTSLHLHKNIIRYKWNQIALPDIVQLKSDSFKTWVNNASQQLPADLDSLRNSLAITIVQRIGTTGNDALLAQLIFDYADLAAKDKSYLLAIPFYKEAVTHNPSLAAVAGNRQEIISEIDQSVSDTFRWASVIYAVPLLALVFVLIVWIKNRYRNPEEGDTGIN